jgi:hypothetical protein
VASTVIQSDLHETILKLDAERVEAMIKRDVVSLDKLLASDLSYVHSGGRADSKQSFIDFISSPISNYLAVDYSEVEVIECATNVVVVRGIARLHLGARVELPDETYSVFFSDVWVLRHEGWQMVTWHATRVPD